MGNSDALRSGRSVLVTEFQRALDSESDFQIQEIAGGDFTVSSGKCVFLFSFERGSVTSYNLTMFPPRQPRLESSFLVLRHIRSGRIEGDRGAPSDHARVVNIYFRDILSGDFSFMEAYGALEVRVLNGFERAAKLSPNDPVRAKMRAFDFSWLSDVERS